MPAKPGVVPVHIARMSAARSMTAKHRPAGSVVNPSRLRARPRGYLGLKESSQIDAEDRLLASLLRDGHNILTTSLAEFIWYTDKLCDQDSTKQRLITEHSLVPHIMIDNELGQEPYTYLPIKYTKGYFKLRDKVGILHYTTACGNKIGEGDLEFALWQETKVAWRLPQIKQESGV
jgi:hypothetical protein